MMSATGDVEARLITATDKYRQLTQLYLYLPGCHVIPSIAHRREQALAHMRALEQQRQRDIVIKSEYK